ncbi:TlpA disulfide reductase family protein [Streptomyces sp. H10-C2]|uniref:TlpA family protein disulfide reductase n=1 Tax=unclassified Streptomyces TaxID=2593676 RepID=UPI0024BB1A7B|nr:MULTISPECIES: TlpA disulfide reductase family protein [unclassified Streptomyces]MDJ0346597.1 TlpA disulfide reductase family protein [Streptomyces sp. PH10-H1]MDJ0375030.1 TlpA disulfide reductase family protein [Streptomyces sp. H10-C2]
MFTHPPPRRRRLMGAVVVAVATLVLVVTGLFAFGGSGRKPAGTSTSPTAFALPRLSGPGLVRLADFHGRPVVVNFFASWCTACDFELPGFAHVSTELQGEVTFVGVDSLETGDPGYMPTRHHITWWPLARDIGGANGSGLHDALGGGSGMPMTAFYDSGGKLLAVQRGALPEDALRTEITQLYGIPTATRPGS